MVTINDFVVGFFTSFIILEHCCTSSLTTDRGKVSFLNFKSIKLKLIAT